MVTVTVDGEDFTAEVEYVSMQIMTLAFDKTYAEGDTVEVTIGTSTYSYTLEIGQGGPDAAATIAQGLLDAMNEGDIADYGFFAARNGSTIALMGSNDAEDLNADNVTWSVDANQVTVNDNALGRSVTTQSALAAELADAISANSGFSADSEGSELTLTANNIEADVEITADNAVAEVVTVADTLINGFETLNLVALDPQFGDTEGDVDGADFYADFDLIEGVTDINLTSEVSRIATDNGAYTSYESGDDVQFNLYDLRGGETITVAANEVTATGNPHVSVVTVANGDGDHLVGDKLSVLFNGLQLDYFVTENDLSTNTAQGDANRIAQSLVDFVQDAVEA